MHWARVRMWEELTKVLHKSSLARMIIVYLHYGRQAPYLTFHEGVIDEFFPRETTLHGALIHRHPSAPNLRSAVDYQKNVIILPSYDGTLRTSFATDSTGW